jgi:hypothetical protein
VSKVFLATAANEMWGTAMIRRVSLDRHEPPHTGSVERDARRPNRRARSVSRVEAIDVPEHRLRQALRERLALKNGAAYLTAPLR